MKPFLKTLFLTLLTFSVLAALTGCRSLVEEDPNEAQLPWATPADWEGSLPGMPAQGY